MLQPKQSARAGSPAKTLKVLYVDDEPQALKYFAKALAPEIDVIPALSVDEALQVLERRGDEIAVLATDQRMPVKTGLDLLKVVHARWPDIVTALVTANADLDEVIDSINLGRVSQYHLKPWNADKLKIKMLEAIRQFDRLRQDRELSRINEELRRATVQQEQFINMLSHEVRTPVGISTNLAERLLNEPLDARQAEFAKTIKIVNDNLLALLNNTLDYSKWSAGELKLSQIDFRLDAICQQISSIFKIQAEASGVRYSVDLSPAASRTYKGDPEKIAQVLINLVGNALKHTPKNGEIRVEALEESRRGAEATLRFNVRNTGEGIDPSVRDRLFQPFAKATDSIRGTGLGLSISSRLVSLMGGEIGFESAAGEGSEFWFTANAQAAAPLRSKPSPASNGSRILVADDDPIFRHYLDSILAKEGYSLDIVENGKEVLELASRERYDLILMDCQMPILNGFDTARALRQSALNRHAPIIAITALNAPGVERRLSDAGFDGSIPKPFKPFVFIESVRHWIANSARAKLPQEEKVDC